MNIAASRERAKSTVLHFVQCWLPQTMTWQYSHLKSLPPDIESHIVCQWTTHLDQFPFENLLSLERPPMPLGIFGRIRRRLGYVEDERRHVTFLEEAVRRLKPNVIHSHFGQCGWLAARVAHKYQIRHVVNFYGLDLSYLPQVDPRWIARYRQMSDLVDLVLCEGPHMASCLVNLGIDASKVKVFRLGIALAKIPFVPRRNPGGSLKRFLIAGSFREKKGIPYALEALGRFNKNHPEIEITVIGDSGGSEREAREKKKILDMVALYGLQSKTRFLGYQPYESLICEFYRHDVFLSPSVTSSDGDTEGGAPVTIIEAAGSGMPVISTRHCDIPFVLSDENKSFLVAERDSISLHDAIERLFGLQDWGPLVAANRRLVEEELDVERQAERLAEIYRGLATDSGHG
jgi:colanic acid/amylovoran biosynthesis glycosyltransferase